MQDFFMNEMFSLSIYSMIGICGAVGGLGRAIASNSKHDLAIPFKGNGIRLGFLGDMLLGGIAGLISIAIVDAIAGEWLLLKCHSSVFNKTECGELKIENHVLKIRLFAVSFLAGFSGLKLMDRLSDGVLKKLEEQLEKAQDQANNATEIAKESESRSLSIEAYRKCDKKQYLEAKELMDEAIKLSRTPLILSRASVVLSEEAIYLRSQGVDAEKINKNWEDGLLLIDEALNEFQKSPSLRGEEKNLLHKLYWNKACNLALLGKGKKQIERALIEAYNMEPFNMNDLKEEKDFNTLDLNSEEMKDLNNLLVK